MVDDYHFQLCFTNIIPNPKTEIYNEYRWERRVHTDVVKEWTDERLVIDRDQMLEYIDDHYMVRILCPVYNETTVRQVFNEKPKEMKFTLNEFDYDEMFE